MRRARNVAGESKAPELLGVRLLGLLLAAFVAGAATATGQAADRALVQARPAAPWGGWPRRRHARALQ